TRWSWFRWPSRSSGNPIPSMPRTRCSIACASRYRDLSTNDARSVMARFPKPAEGSWTEHYPELGTAPVSYEDSISPEFYEREREAIFKRAWLNVGRVEQLPKSGSYFTKEIQVAKASIIVVRDADGRVRAFHNICRHRGNKLAWNDFPREETQ